jgi:hypothetical protein
MSAGDVVFISGATGLWSAGINGPYDRTDEESGGYSVFLKRGDGSVCVEHHEGEWKVRHVSDRGGLHRIAFVSGNCAFEDCTFRVWRVSISMNTLFDQPLKLAFGPDAEREVTHLPLHAFRPPPTPTRPSTLDAI